MIHARTAIITLFVFSVLSACGGGGGSSTARPVTGTGGVSVQPVSSFVPGQFLSSTNFRASCAAPRTGTDATSGSIFPDSLGPQSDEKKWLRSWSNNLYLWFDEIVDVDPETHAGSTISYFNLLKTNAFTLSGSRKDNFHFSIDTAEYRARSQSGVAAGYGFTFAILEATTPRRIVVAYAEPNLPFVNTSVVLARGASISGWLVSMTLYWT
ncbi:MAG: hypothetical protein VB957_10760 [Pseudomonadales bacterium]